MIRSFGSDDGSTNRNQAQDPMFSYDPKGNAVRFAGKIGQQAGAIWNSNNLMTAYVEGDPWSASGIPAESYRYDAGRFRWLRVGRDGTPVISLRDGSGQPQAEYVIDVVSGAPKRTREYVYGLGQVLAERRASGSSFTTFYHHRDHLGSLRVLTDSAGLAREAHDYYPYGQEMGGGAPGDDPKKFTGHERDEATGLDYMLARYYGSTIGMFLSPDPLAGSVQAADPLSWNRYSYVRGNPIMRIDPTGEADDGNSTEPKKPAMADGEGRPATPGAEIDGVPKAAEPDKPSWSPEKPVPDNPDGLGPGWTKNPKHLDPNGSEWVNGNGEKMEFNKGRPGQTGFKGKDHWHYTPPGGDRSTHVKPGDKVPGPGIGTRILDSMRKITPAPIAAYGTAAIIVFFIIDEGSRVVPARNLVPVP